MKTEEIIKQTLEEIDGAIASFNDAIPAIQQQISDKIQRVIKDLDLDGDNVARSAKNYRLLGGLKKDIQRIILNPQYIDTGKEFFASYNTIANLNNSYFKAIVGEHKPSDLLEALKADAIESMASSLTEAGITANITDPLQEIIRTSIRSGGSYAKLTEQLRTSIIGEKGGDGALERYARTITTTGINQFSAAYNDSIARDLGLQWNMFVGSLLTTSRPFCVALEEMKYYHDSQLPDILKGHIGDKTIPINSKTGVWAGGIAGTDVANFNINRGGWNCGHQSYPISEKMVPEAVRLRLGKGELPPAVKGVFIPSKTIQEAESFARNNELAKEISYKGLDVYVANNVNKVLLDAKNKSGVVYDKIKSINQKSNPAIMQNNVKFHWTDKTATKSKDHTFSLEINRAYFDQFKNEEEATAAIVSLRKRNWTAAEDMDGVVWHEFGHRLTTKKILDDQLNAKFEKKVFDYERLGRYATTNIEETLSEILVYYKKTGDAPDAWKKLFNKWSETKIEDL